MSAVMRQIRIEPPRGAEPLYEWIRRHADAGTAVPDALPDQPEPGPDDLRWAPGALDGIMTHHAGVPETHVWAASLAELALRASRRPVRRLLWRLHDTLATSPALEYLDALLERLVEEPDVDAEALRQVGLWLATCGTLRDPVKVGIGLVGIAGVGDARRDLLVLGRHDEFTLFVTVAFANTADDPEGSLWELAQHVDGWGRIHAVERLAHTEDPGIKAWLLREGYRNTVMNEYLAYVAATAGGLVTALEAARIDDALRRGAGDMIRALLVGGPAEGIDDYPDGADAVAGFLRHVEPAHGTLDDFVTLVAISEHLADTDADWERRAARGWSATVRQWMEQRCAELLSHPRWWALAVTGMSADDGRTVELAHRAARHLGVETFDLELRRLRGCALDPSAWHRALRDCPPGRLEELLDIARGELPLTDIATGPAHDLGLGPEHVPHNCLGSIVQELQRHPGKGWDLIVTALHSPVTHNRNAAVSALIAWGQEAWPPGARRMLEAARQREPHDDTRDAIVSMLATSSRG